MFEILKDLVQGWFQIQTGFDEVDRADLVLESGILRLGIIIKREGRRDGSTVSTTFRVPGCH